VQNLRAQRVTAVGSRRLLRDPDRLPTSLKPGSEHPPRRIASTTY